MKKSIILTFFLGCLFLSGCPSHHRHEAPSHEGMHGASHHGMHGDQADVKEEESENPSQAD